MNTEEYNLILRALNVFEEHEEEKDLKNTLIEKINLYVEHDVAQDEYNKKMKKISDKMTKLLSPKEDSK